MRKNNQSIGSNAVLALLVAVAALGCAGQQQRGVATDAPSTTERNKGVVREFYVGGSLRLAPTTLIAEGEWVFAEASGRAELRNGRVYEPHSAWVFHVEDGRIVEIREFIDTKHSYEVFLSP